MSKPYRRWPMFLILVAVATVLYGSLLSAQAPGATPTEHTRSPNEDAGSGSLPVSLSHIRRGLSQPAEALLLNQAEIPADFKVRILEQARIDDLLSKLDFKSGTGPTPAGGIYAYEQQRRLFNPTERPLMQPYAAYSGGEFLVVALENLLGRYLARRLSSGGSQPTDPEAQAEVARAIADYCAARPDRAAIHICDQ